MVYDDTNYDYVMRDEQASFPDIKSFPSLTKAETELQAIVNAMADQGMLTKRLTVDSSFGQTLYTLTLYARFDSNDGNGNIPRELLWQFPVSGTWAIGDFEAKWTGGLKKSNMVTTGIFFADFDWEHSIASPTFPTPSAAANGGTAGYLIPTLRTSVFPNSSSGPTPSSGPSSPSGATPSGADSDGDTVADSADVFPCDDTRSSRTYYPAQGQSVLITFEDLHPNFSDNDFNDVTFHTHMAYDADASGRVVDMYAVIDPVALGGRNDNGLAVQFPFKIGRAHV